MKMVINISRKLENYNKHPSIYSCHTLKPFDNIRLKKIFNNYKNIIIIEDHSIILEAFLVLLKN